MRHEQTITEHDNIAAVLHFFGITAPWWSASASLRSAACDDPPSSTAFRHTAFISAVFSLALLPYSPSASIRDRTARSSSAASTKLSRFLSTLSGTATPMSATS